MGAGLAIIALIGGAASVAIVGYHGIFLAFVTASVGGSFSTLMVAFLGDMLQRGKFQAPAADPAPLASDVTPIGPA